MSRPWKRPRSISHGQFFGCRGANLNQNRPVILYVDLHEVPDLLDLLHCPAAYQLTSTNISNLSDEEEMALLTYMNFFRPEELNTKISLILERILNHINLTWNAAVHESMVCLSVANPLGDRHYLRNTDSLGDILRTHRPW